MLIIDDNLQIPLREFEFTFARSGGPGGQNVNKVNSKAILRWRITEGASLPESVRQRFVARFGRRITIDGDLIITSQRYRDQNRNADDCLAKLSEMLAAVAKAPVKRRPTKPSQAAQKRRIESKVRTSVKKQQRRRPVIDLV